MINRLLSKVSLPIAWTILIQVLLCIPGSDLPSGDLFDIPHLDKIVHIILFGTLTGLWCYYYYLKGKPAVQLKTIFFIVFLLAAFNGIALEFVQKNFIPNRSFDDGDIIADVLASSIAYGICNIKLLKI
ncbi:MAG: VanZ family protein [Chitinophagaceae bacterium]